MSQPAAGGSPAQPGTMTVPVAQRRLGDLAPRLARAAAGLGCVGVGVSLVFGFVDGWEVFFRSYILNYAYVLSFALGALFFVLLQHVTGASWSVVVRRLAELLAGTIPILALLFVPILVPVVLGLPSVYPWSDPATVHGDPLLAGKRPYLNAPFFVLRCVAYFAVWALLARYYLRRSVAQDHDGEVGRTLAMQRWSGPGLVLYGLTVTWFSVDVLKSLTPQWYSTIFGVYYFAGALVGFFALLALLMAGLQRAGRLSSAITTEHYHDVGKLAFGFTVFWAYIAFSQYMLHWYANLPEETLWYAARQSSPWWVGVSLLLVLGHFALPVLMLLSRAAKRRRRLLVPAGVWLLLMHWVDTYYLVGPPVPAGHADGPHHATTLHVTDISLLVGLGGLALLATVRLAARHDLLPSRDPRLTESLAFENI